MLRWKDDNGLDICPNWYGYEYKLRAYHEIWSDVYDYDINPIYHSGSEIAPNEQTKLILRKKRKNKSQRKSRKLNRK